MLVLSLALTLWDVPGCGRSERDSTMTPPRDTLAGISVSWTGTDVGLVPVLDDAGETRIRALGPADVDDLIRALSDEGTFVAAHVALTRVSGVEYEALPRWNGLEVRLDASGQAHVDPEQRHLLARRWTKWRDESPRPGRLPDA